MKIINSCATSFMATKKAKKKFLKANKEENIVKKHNSSIQKNFYNDIENFNNNKITKEEYLKNFLKNVNTDIYKKLNNIEKKYVHDILTMLDFADSENYISEAYLKEHIQNLLKKTKSL